MADKWRLQSLLAVAFFDPIVFNFVKLFKYYQ